MTQILKLLILGLFHVCHIQAGDYPFYSWINYYEKYHHPSLFTTSMKPVVDEATGYRRPQQRWTPDFRLSQPMLDSWDTYYIETHRPYRISPHYKITKYFPHQYGSWRFGCYCTTAFKRFTLLAGCAVITTRHILTTATSTHLVLRKYKKAPTLDGVLGFWYDVSRNWYNSSIYSTPCRIHYHPLYTYPKNVNRSHPLPVMFDISVWAATIRHHGSVVLCTRAAPHKWDMQSATPRYRDMMSTFGYQFMRAYNRRPYVFFKYVVIMPHTDGLNPCPVTQWGWYHCMKTGSWAPLGMDHGAPMHRQCRASHRRYDGLVGLNVLTMKLRAVQQISYYIDLNNHIVMGFLYKAYNGQLPYIYLDERFDDTYNAAPRVKQGHWVSNWRPSPYAHYSHVHCCFPEVFRPGFL